MAMFNAPVPFRHPATQRPNGVDHSRPNSVAFMSNSINRREMVHGSFEASIFDMDKICMIPASQVQSINSKCLNIVNSMGWQYQR